MRANNEDYFISDSESGIFILADGMGGANAGECASRLSAETIYEYLLTIADQEGPDLLERGFVEANRAVREAARSNPELTGMGTTLVVAREVGERRMQIGSVGDSRAYLCSDGLVSLLTQDQTWVAEVGTRLGLSEEVLKKHPMRHVLTMAVGSTDELRVATSTVQMRPGDFVLLCSDGLHGIISEEFLGEALDSEKTLREKCHYLVEAAKSEGGPDNVTVVLIKLV